MINNSTMVYLQNKTAEPDKEAIDIADYDICEKCTVTYFDLCKEILIRCLFCNDCVCTEWLFRLR